MIKTQYQVQTLLETFRRIDSGEIHIPSFQRPFVWGKKEIIKLLDSIYKGLPIGTLIFLRTREKNLNCSDDDFISTSSYQDHNTYWYVIDGTQRLQVLYHCLHSNHAHKDSRFWVGFDLNKETFIHLKKADNLAEVIVLSSLFSSEEIIKKQISLSSKENNQYLLKTLNKLVSAFVEYQLLVITMDEDNLTKEEIVTIFERINSIGISLSEEEILRAKQVNT
ncbi:protein of unknown function DUF262 [Rippkaea orientalis PCC 8801]|uniref:GmrSD restriction endonucleases N-terminal domain-containing protein n=1 Tax=Rippkaea orientalis (strain PCC 8801 / RF-1) TaxID=41431 RepID=B7K1C4_RIPO1|nr:DUF262 domain-containing protein [Rippkaea orientalis]ACK66319.1 protein of unknown function DUF262 [Rippkaea orientalis PCC 8801]